MTLILVIVVVWYNDHDSLTRTVKQESFILKILGVNFQIDARCIS